jgi:polyisoprenoid-binding protein YceI
MRRLILLAAAFAVLLGASGGAAWWFLVREDNKLATSAPDIPDDLADATASETPAGTAAVTQDATAGDAVTYQINADLSEAAYFVDEELASIGLPSTAKGTTNEIDGQFELTADGAALAPGATSSFTVDLRNLTSDESRRDGRVQDALDTSQFPTATFTVSTVTGYDPAVPEGEEQEMQLTGTLDLHGVQREVTWDVKAKREGNVISALATLTVSFADFDITAPTFGGLVSISDEPTLQVQLIAQAV